MGNKTVDTVLLGIMISLLVATLFVMMVPIGYETVRVGADKIVLMTNPNFQDIRGFTKAEGGRNQPIGIEILKYEGIPTVEYCLISCYQWTTIHGLGFRFVRGGEILEIQYDPNVWVFEGLG